MSAVNRVASELTRESGRGSLAGATRRASRGDGFRGTVEDGLRASQTAGSSSQPTQLAQNPGTQSVEAVRKACADSGLNIAGCTFSYNDELVWTPWGSYPNPQVQVRDGTGRLYSFNADLALRSPGVTAQELREMMNSPGQTAAEELSQIATPHVEAPKADTKVAGSTTNTGSLSVEAVRKACLESGMATDGCTFAYNDDLVWSPWGGYRNPQVQITLPDGRLYSFNAELALQNPKLTAYELRQMQQSAKPQDV
jgi:hypothetical protein